MPHQESTRYQPAPDRPGHAPMPVTSSRTNDPRQLDLLSVLTVPRDKPEQAETENKR